MIDINKFLLSHLTGKKNKLTNYIILDCAHFDHKLYREIRKDRLLTSKSLFANTTDEESAFAGPILIELDLIKNQTFIKKVEQIEQEKPAVIWLFSTEPFNHLFSNLQFLLRGKQENGQNIFCRYYDPRCIQTFLKLYKTHSELSQRTKSIKAWAYWDSTNNEYIYLD